QQGRTLSRTDLLKRVWGFHEETQTRTLDTFIMRLRHHFSELGASPELIESVRGVGYRLVAPPKEQH
ncbi:MAG: helix-turn-helix domain-containing protein, partial [Bdellovibrionota bacterium]